jgi:hypothetical protein
MQSHNHSICIRPDLLPYTVLNMQTITLNFTGNLANIERLHMYRSRMTFSDDNHPFVTDEMLVDMGTFNVVSV